MDIRDKLLKERVLHAPFILINGFMDDDNIDIDTQHPFITYLDYREITGVRSLTPSEERRMHGSRSLIFSNSRPEGRGYYYAQTVDEVMELIALAKEATK